MGTSASVIQARLDAEHGDKMDTWLWSDEMRDEAIESITKTYESTLAATSSPEEAYQAIKSEYLAAKKRAGEERPLDKNSSYTYAWSCIHTYA